MDLTRNHLKKMWFWIRFQTVSLYIFLISAIMMCLFEVRRFMNGVMEHSVSYYLYYSGYLAVLLLFYFVIYKDVLRESDQLTVDILRCN